MNRIFKNLSLLVLALAVSASYGQTIQGTATAAKTVPATGITGTLTPAQLPALGASGAGHSAGIAPDPGSTAGTTRYLREDGTWAAPAGGAGLTSFTAGNLSPLFTTALGASPTTAPALAFTPSTAAQNYILAGPSTGGAGAYSFRALVPADIPLLNQSTNGNAATASALAATPTLCSTGQAPTGVLANGNATGCASITGGSGLADPGANGLVYRSAPNTTTAATAAQVEAALASDTTKNTAFTFSTGSGGDATVPAPATGKDTLAMKAGSIEYSHNGGAYVPLSYFDVTSSIQTQLDSKQAALTLTTAGSSGPATLVGNTINIPQYTGGSSGPSMIVPRDLNYHMAVIEPDSNSTELFAISLIDSVGTQTFNAALDGSGYGSASRTTGTTINTGTGDVGQPASVFNNPSLHSVFHLGSAANVNAWVGLCSYCQVGVTGTLDVSGTSAVAMVGFRHFSGTESTNWTCYIGDGTHAGATADSTVAVDTAKMQVFDVIWVSGTPQFFINGTRVCSGISTTQLPPTTTIMGATNTWQNTTTTAVLGYTYELYFGSN